MEPDYKKMYEELTNKIYDEWRMENCVVNKAKSMPWWVRIRNGLTFIAYHEGQAMQSFRLLTFVEELKKKYGLNEGPDR